jgi:hypothetical protein
MGLRQKDTRFAGRVAGACLIAWCIGSPAGRAATVEFLGGSLRHGTDAKIRNLANANTVINATTSNQDVTLPLTTNEAQVVSNPQNLTAGSPAASVSTDGTLAFTAVGASELAVTGFDIFYTGTITASQSSGSSIYAAGTLEGSGGMMGDQILFNVPLGADIRYTLAGDITLTNPGEASPNFVGLYDPSSVGYIDRVDATSSITSIARSGVLSPGLYGLEFSSILAVDSRAVGGLTPFNDVTLEFSLSFSAVPEPGVVAASSLIALSTLRRRRTLG